MSGTTPKGHVPQPHYFFTGVRDMHARCTDQFEALFHMSPVFASRPWRAEFDRVRSWGRNLYAFGDDRRTLENHLKEAGALGRALMSTFENIEKELTKCAELTQTPSFKIAGIDVLATGENPSPTRNEDEIRRLNEVASAVTNLYVLYNVPMTSVPGPYAAGPPAQGPFSSRDDQMDPHEMMASGSGSPVQQDGSAKRARRYSQSSTTASAPYFRPALTYGDTASSESLQQRMQGMPATGPGQMMEHADPQGPSKRPTYGVANPPRFMPIYTPTHLPHHPQHGYAYGGGQKVSFVSNDGPGMDGGKGQDRQHRVEDFMSDDENGIPRGDHRQLTRLSIPSEAGDNPDSANHTPKLTKTGRVSKALRGEPVHACNICDKVYTRAEHLRRHRSNHRVNLMRQPVQPPER